VSDDATGYGPIFEEEPVDVVYMEDSPDGRISMNCRARANPPASYRSHHRRVTDSTHTRTNTVFTPEVAYVMWYDMVWVGNAS